MTRSIVYGPAVDIDMGGNPITNVEDPTNDQDAATKKYVDDNAGSGGGAPADATYITQTANGGLSAEQALSALSTGLVKVTTTTGVLSTATPGTDYVADIAASTHAATGKTTPVDNDEFALVDSAASNVLKKLLWSNLKATLKTYFDTLYASSSGSAPIGTPELIYRYEVTGSDKASIDTGADTPDAGSNDWTGGDLLEVYIYARTDEAVVFSVYDVTVNNDSSAIYDSIYSEQINATNGTGNNRAQTKWQFLAPGSSAAANNFGAYELTFANYAGTVGYKSGNATGGFADATAANCVQDQLRLSYRSTSALTRLKIVPNTAAKKFKVGSQLLIYKRRNA